jgi:septal ring-binding cell division protein DamX
MFTPLNPRKALVLGALLPILYVGDIPHEAPAGLALMRQAHAIVGAPLTPVSVAGVARRSTYRAVAATSATAAATNATAQQQAATAQQQQATAEQQAATAQQQAATAQQQTTAARPAGAPATGAVVAALPAGCKPEVRSGVEYQNCGGVLYRAAFQGNNLVYVVQ